MQGLDLAGLITVVCDHLPLSPVLLKSPAEQSRIARARAIIAHIAFDTVGLRGVGIAQTLRLTPAAVSKLAPKGRTDPLAGKIEKLLYENL